MPLKDLVEDDPVHEAARPKPSSRTGEATPPAFRPGLQGQQTGLQEVVAAPRRAVLISKPRQRRDGLGGTRPSAPMSHAPVTSRVRRVLSSPRRRLASERQISFDEGRGPTFPRSPEEMRRLKVTAGSAKSRTLGRSTRRPKAAHRPQRIDARDEEPRQWWSNGRVQYGRPSRACEIRPPSISAVINSPNSGVGRGSTTVRRYRWRRFANLGPQDERLDHRSRTLLPRARAMRSRAQRGSGRGPRTAR